MKSRPSTLAEEFIRDLLAVTGGGKARSFIDVRDHAIIRMLTEGVRRTELAQSRSATCRRTWSPARSSGWCR